MGKSKNLDAVTPFAKLREEYNETHDKTLSQTDMGKIAHVSKSTISRIENGTKPPSTEVIKAYSEYFNVSLEYLTDIKQPEEAIPAREMGISEEVINTYNKIAQLSNHDENIRAVLNSLVGNDINTIFLLESILSYLSNQQANGSNKQIENIFIENILHYVNDIMKPQLQKVIKKNVAWHDELVDNHNFDDAYFKPKDKTDNHITSTSLEKKKDSQ